MLFEAREAPQDLMPTAGGFGRHWLRVRRGPGEASLTEKTPSIPNAGIKRLSDAGSAAGVGWGQKAPSLPNAGFGGLSDADAAGGRRLGQKCPFTT